ncbi:MAG: hypothetical protein EXS63_05690 [Candidatus Omnitrophica bacterium]|nr:hypothetical protein [Candidatus Omnitrophota bacterium]
MQKESWLQIISDRIKTQLSLEGGRKIQTWAVALAGLVALMMAVNVMTGSPARAVLEQTKVLFLVLFHLILVLAVYLPEWLQKGDKVLPRLFGVRDFTSLVFVALALMLVSFYVFSLSYQNATNLGDDPRLGFLIFNAWANVSVSGFYLAGFIFYFSSILFFPKALTHVLDRMGNRPIVFLSIHVGMFLLGYFSYSGIVEIGSGNFFEQLRLAGLFWIFAGSLVFLVGKILEESSVGSLNALHMEVASGKLERSEDILSRIKQAFISKRLSFWLSRISLETAKKSHEIAQYLHQSVSIIEQGRPSESQLTQMEERYRRSNQIFKKLDQSHQRFLLNISFFSLLDVEREKVDDLKDQFSKELRHAKLELASVRKRIDDKLHAMKDSERSEVTLTEVPLEQIPVER